MLQHRLGMGGVRYQGTDLPGRRTWHIKANSRRAQEPGDLNPPVSSASSNAHNLVLLTSASRSEGWA